MPPGRPVRGIFGAIWTDFGMLPGQSDASQCWQRIGLYDPHALLVPVRWPTCPQFRARQAADPGRSAQCAVRPDRDPAGRAWASCRLTTPPRTQQQARPDHRRSPQLLDDNLSSSAKEFARTLPQAHLSGRPVQGRAVNEGQAGISQLLRYERIGGELEIE
jgi:hypothetical protein